MHRLFLVAGCRWLVFAFYEGTSTLVLVIRTPTFFLYQHIGVAQLIQACGHSSVGCGEAKELGSSPGSSTRRKNLAHRLSNYYLCWWTPIVCVISDGAVKTSSVLLWASESVLFTCVWSFCNESSRVAFSISRGGGVVLGRKGETGKRKGGGGELRLNAAVAPGVR